MSARGSHVPYCDTTTIVLASVIAMAMNTIRRTAVELLWSVGESPQDTVICTTSKCSVVYQFNIAAQRLCYS